MRDLWYKDAVIYCLDVDRFMDGDGDGIGDFKGLKDKLSYISGLGVNCLWLLPFYRSPGRDNGYDVMDYLSVDPPLGDLGDFVEFMHLAKERGLRVIVDLVVNHTSDQHPWFQQARSDPKSPYRDYYVWSKTKPEDAHEGMVFPGVQHAIWTYDRKAGEYYLHRFYEHQPDLNVANPKVRDEIERVMGFWLQLGVSGFRMDAAPFVVEMKGVDGAEVSDPLEFLADFRSFLTWRRGDAILLAEANLAPAEMPPYFEGGKLQHVVHLQAFVEGFKLPAIVGVAGGQVEGDCAVFVERGRVDLGAPAPTRAAQSLVAAVFFGAPAACGWARTVVESKSTPGAPAKGSACRFFQSRCQTPRASQRRKRM